MMLEDRRATHLDFDPATDVLHVATAEAEESGHTSGVWQPRKVSLLLDAKGFLVGADTRDAAGRGVVVMLGPDAEVSSKAEAVVKVSLDASGRVTALRIPGARAAARAHEQNPYLK